VKIRGSNRRQFLRNGLATALGAAAVNPLITPAFGGLSLGGESQAAAPATTSGARIKIDLERRNGEIDRNIYGNFIEHLGRCIYGGIYEVGSPLSDSDGFRKDVLEAARGLHIPLLRWPGGNFSSGYNWKDGIGPKDSRPRRWDTAWQAEESNRFGTDEFMQYCQKLAAEPYITINMGTGTMQDAADWVEYCNATTDTYWANLRKKNGHPQPYGVKYWGLGNEIYGPWQAGHKSAAEYAAEALEFAKMMRWIDPSIKLVACGGNNADWDRQVLEALVDEVDYISLHHYGGSTDTAKEMLDARKLEEQIRVLDSVITIVKPKDEKSQRVKIAADEWNIWFRSWFKRNDDHKLEEVYNLRDALWVASAINIFHRQCKTVQLANLAQLVNVIAPIVANSKGIVLQTIYHPLKLYAEHSENISLDPLVRSDSFPDDPKTPYIDISATTNASGTALTLAIVNRHPSSDIAVDILLEGFSPQNTCEVYEVNGASLDSTNTFDHPNDVVIKQRTLAGIAANFRQTFAAHSLSVLTLKA
jgi:alpha-N-arabinofuranosidase